MDVNSCSRVTVQCHCLSEANTSIFRNRSLSSFQATSSDLNWKVKQVSCTIFYSATASTSLLSSSPSAFFFLKLICFASTLWRLSCFRSRKCIPQGTPFPLTSKLHLYPVGQTASFVPLPWNICSSPHVKCCINVGFREAPCKKSFGILASYWTPPKIK